MEDLNLGESLFGAKELEAMDLWDVQAEHAEQLADSGLADKAYASLAEASQGIINRYPTRVLAARCTLPTESGAVKGQQLKFLTTVPRANGKMLTTDENVTIGAVLADGSIDAAPGFETNEAQAVEAMLRDLETRRELGLLPNLNLSCTKIK
jgi:hypothetical protein